MILAGLSGIAVGAAAHWLWTQWHPEGPLIVHYYHYPEKENMNIIQQPDKAVISPNELENLIAKYVTEQTGRTVAQLHFEEQPYRAVGESSSRFAVSATLLPKEKE